MKSILFENQAMFGVAEIVVGTAAFVVGLPLARNTVSVIIDCGVGVGLIYDGAARIDMVQSRRKAEAYATETREADRG